MPKFQTQVGPLKRGYKYEFKVRPYGSNLYGRESNTQDLRVPEIGENLTRTSCNNLLLCVHQQCYGVYRNSSCSVPSAPPSVVSMTVNHDQNNTIRLSWEPPPPETHNGIIQGYQVIPALLTARTRPHNNTEVIMSKVTSSTTVIEVFQSQGCGEKIDSDLCVTLNLYVYNS